jgi:predicted transcriptional regulator
MEPLAVGVMPPERMRARLSAIAKGEMKRQPGEPNVWFASTESLSAMLNDSNLALLRIIADKQPTSIPSLAAMTGQKPKVLLGTLKNMSNCGIVELRRNGRSVYPVAKAVEFRIVTI